MAELKKWSCSQANEWYEKQPWFRGCNYMPADCANLGLRNIAYNMDRFCTLMLQNA